VSIVSIGSDGGWSFAHPNIVRDAIGAAPVELVDYTPYGGRDNYVTDLLLINLNDKYGIVNRASVVATEDASTLVNSPIKSGAFYAYREVLFIDSPTGGISKCIVRLTLAYPHHGTIITNIYDANYGYWMGWEWFNPPMSVGVEYRTTERWNDKPVYTKLVDCGAVTNDKIVNIMSTQVTVHRYSGILDENVPSPPLSSYMAPNVFYELSIYKIANGVQARIFCGPDVAGQNLKLQIWYTK
jgi:hypothetical protein